MSVGSAVRPMNVAIMNGDTDGAATDAQGGGTDAETAATAGESAETTTEEQT